MPKLENAGEKTASSPQPSPPKEERETEPRIPSINLLIQWQCSLRGGERALEIADRGSFAIGSRPSDFFRISDFGLRISAADGPCTCALARPVANPCQS